MIQVCFVELATAYPTSFTACRYLSWFSSSLGGGGGGHPPAPAVRRWLRPPAVRGLKFACTDFASESNNSERLSFLHIIKHIFSTHRVKFGASSRKNEVTGYNVLMGKSLWRTL